MWRARVHKYSIVVVNEQGLLIKVFGTMFSIEAARSLVNLVYKTWMEILYFTIHTATVLILVHKIFHWVRGRVDYTPSRHHKSKFREKRIYFSVKYVNKHYLSVLINIIYVVVPVMRQHINRISIIITKPELLFGVSHRVGKDHTDLSIKELSPNSSIVPRWQEN